MKSSVSVPGRLWSGVWAGCLQDKFCVSCAKPRPPRRIGHGSQNLEDFISNIVPRRLHPSYNISCPPSIEFSTFRTHQTKSTLSVRFVKENRRMYDGESIGPGSLRMRLLISASQSLDDLKKRYQVYSNPSWHEIEQSCRVCIIYVFLGT